MLEEFALAYIERLQRQTIKPAIFDNWWGDSHTKDLEGFWQQKLRATPDYLKVQDPDLFVVGADSVVDYAIEHDLPFTLGVDNNILQNGPFDEIEKRIHEYMEAAERSGKGTLYLCSLSAVTPAENVRFAIDCIHRFRAGERPHAGLRRSGQQQETPADTAAVAVPRIARDEDAVLDDIFDAVLDYDEEATAELVRGALEGGMDVHLVLDEALIAAMDDVGAQFAEGSLFVPEMLMAARAMKAGLEVVRPVLTQTGAPSKGRVMLATVQGDVHDIGKNLVGMMLEGAGYEVRDIGINVTADEVLEQANDFAPDVVGLSALLTTSMPSMQKTVALFKQTGSRFPVIVGGAPVTEDFATRIGADGYGENAPMAVETVHRLVAAAEKAASAA